MKKKTIGLFAAFAMLAASLPLFTAQAEASAIGAITEQEGIAVHTTYNFNNGEGEIGSFSYRNVSDEKTYESFGSGYGGYFTARNRWQEAPLLLETENDSAEYVFGTQFTGSFTFVGRGLQTLYATAGEREMDYSSLTFTFANEEQTMQLTLSQSNSNDYLLASALYGKDPVTCQTAKASVSLSGKHEGKDYPLYLAFDEETGEVTTRNDDGRKIDTVLCDFTSAGYTPMDYYTVSVSFGNIAQKVTGKDGTSYDAKGRLLVYELCGQPLTGQLVNTVGATVSCFDNLDTLYLGAKYTPKKAFAWDILDGDVSNSLRVSVLDPDGNSVSLEDGRFTAEKLGKYTLVYTATDKGGLSTSKNYYVNVTDVIPQLTCTLAKEYEETCGLRERINIADAVVKKEGKEIAYTVVVMKDGVPMYEFKKGDDAFFIATETGKYTLAYVAQNGTGLLSSFSYSIECIDRAGFALSHIPAELPCNVPFALDEATVYYNGQTYAPILEIVDPEGNTTATETYEFTPKTVGEYKLRFKAEIDGQTFEKTVVTNSVFINQSLLTSLAGFDERQDGYTVEVYERTAYSGATNVQKTLKEKSGVLLKGTDSTQSFRFVNPINLNEIASTTSLINLFVLTGEGYSAANSLSIRLIDKYDSTNYLTLSYYQSGLNDYYCYVRAGANGREFGRSNEALGGAEGKVWTTLYGTVTLNTLCGTENLNGVYRQAKYNTFGFYYNQAENSVSVATARDWGYGEFFKVIDLDDPDMVGSSGRWEGFSAGEVYLEVSLSGAGSDPLGVVVLDVAGQSLAGKDITDKVAPAIVVNTEYQSNTLPDALVGSRYPIPAAYASDIICGEVSVSVQVTDKAGNALAIEDGAVTPPSVGQYYIRYEAIDRYGNKSQKAYTFQAVADIDDIGMEWEEEPSECIAGETLTVPNILVTGGSGNIHNAQIRITYNGREISLPVSRLLQLTEAGTLRFELANAEDYLGTDFTQAVLTIEVAETDEATIYVQGLPERYVVGSTAYLPEYSATDYGYRADEAEYSPDVEVYVNGVRTEGETFVVSDTGSTELKFVASNGARRAEKSFTVPNVKPDKLADYFVSQTETDKKLSDDGLIVTSSANNPVTFINPLVSEDMTIAFNFAKTISYYDGGEAKTFKGNVPTAVTVTLTDYLDENYKVVLRLTPYNSSQSYLEVNGNGVMNKVRGSFTVANDSVQNFKFLLRAKGDIQDVRSSLAFGIGTFTNGESFEGFPSKLVKVSFAVESKSEASVLIYQLGNQIFDRYSYEYGDFTAPMLRLETLTPSGVVIKGEKITVSAAKAYDALNLYGTVTLRVLVPNEDGSIRTLCSGEIPDESFTLQTEYYGLYTVEYTLCDEVGNREVRSYKYTVRDTVAPTITVNGEIKDVYTVGEEMELPEIFITSAIDPNPTYVVMIYNKSTRYEIVTGQSSVVLKAGDYKLVVYAYDNDYNIATVEYVFEVR